MGNWISIRRNSVRVKTPAARLRASGVMLAIAASASVGSSGPRPPPLQSDVRTGR